MLKISLLHASDYMILTPKIEKSLYRGREDPLPPLGRFAPSHLFSKYFLCFSWSQKSSPHFWRPVYATDGKQYISTTLLTQSIIHLLDQNTLVMSQIELICGRKHFRKQVVLIIDPGGGHFGRRLWRHLDSRIFKIAQGWQLHTTLDIIIYTIRKNSQQRKLLLLGYYWVLIQLCSFNLPTRTWYVQ